MNSHFLPKVSCFCPTFGRPNLLEEAIESFLRQDYAGEKELVILNDYPEQTLHFDHPEIVIKNVSKHILPLGKKFNETANLCSGDILFPWDDDDIYLPWKLSYSVENMHNGIFHSPHAWTNNFDKLEMSENLYQCNLAISRDLWEKVGGYAEEDSSSVDLGLFQRLGGDEITQTLSPEKMFYIYRWAGTNEYHVSSLNTDEKSISHVTSEFLNQKAQNGEIKTGNIHLKPKWSKDWEQLAKDKTETI